MYFDAPYPPYDPTDKTGLSYDTVSRRWPIILTGVVDQLHRDNHDLHISLQTEADSQVKEITEAKIGEGKKVIERVSKLKYQMGRDHVMEAIAEDGEPHVEMYNSELERLSKSSQNTWFKAPWLFAECYLYRVIRSILVQTKHWSNYDPFAAQKLDVFTKSGNAIYQIATIMDNLDAEKDVLRSDPDKIAVIFEDMIQMCLWGNATDLSLLTHISVADIANLQATGKDLDRQAFILKDDQAQVWNHVKSLKDARVDFVLDNAGFELFTDLVFADFLVTYTPHVSKVVFHPKLIPWFVSDVTPPDFAQTIESLLDPSFFPTSTPSESEAASLNRMALRWKKHLDEGVFELSVPLQTPLGGGSEAAAKTAEFWTTPWPYWDMKLRVRSLWDSLAESQLVVFKGDLNYRKLTGDIRWPSWTTFEAALGPLAGSFPILSLRTNKADVVVGVERQVAERLDESGEKWRVDGRYALISFLAKNS